MTPEQLQNIINEKNEELEREAGRRARQIIDEIAKLNSQISCAETRIGELRKELKGITVQPIESISILG